MRTRTWRWVLALAALAVVFGGPAQATPSTTVDISGTIGPDLFGSMTFFDGGSFSGSFTVDLPSGPVDSFDVVFMTPFAPGVPFEISSSFSNPNTEFIPGFSPGGAPPVDVVGLESDVFVLGAPTGFFIALQLDFPSPLTGTEPFLPTDINTYGMGASLFFDPGGFAAVAPSVVPEPSTLVMAGTAALLGAGYAWRRPRQTNAA